MSKKKGGVSWNTNRKSKSGVKTKFKCKFCGRTYKMDWACENHMKQCGGDNFVEENN